MQFTYRQLWYFLAVADRLNFRAAAEYCHISQPTLSVQIKALEERLGVTLFERGGKTVRLTADGADLVARARPVVTAMQDIDSWAQQRKGPLSGRMRVGIIPTIAPYILPHLLPVLLRKYPDLELRLRESTTARLVAALKSGDLDVALLALPLSVSSSGGEPELESRSLFTDAFLLAEAAPDNREAPAPLVTMEELRQYRILLLEDGHCLRDQALDFCRRYGSIAAPELSAASLTTLLEMVASGYGVTFVPEMLARSSATDSRIRLRRFAPPEPQREIGLIWRRTCPRKADYAALGEIITRVTDKAESQADAAHQGIEHAF